LVSACAPPLRMFIIGTGRDAGVGAAEVFVKRQAGALGGGVSDRERDAEDGVGAELGLVSGGVEVEHRGRPPLIGRIKHLDRRRDLVVHAATALRRPCRDSACRRRATPGLVAPVDAPEGTAARPVRAVFEQHLDFDGWVAARIKDLTSFDFLNSTRHENLPAFQGKCGLLARRILNDFQAEGDLGPRFTRPETVPSSRVRVRRHSKSLARRSTKVGERMLDQNQFVRQLQQLLRTEVEGLSLAERRSLILRQLELFEDERELKDTRLHFVPLRPRPSPRR
jgi:hypothetical protein